MRPKNAVPSYLRHQATGKARVVINGKTYYLGEFGSKESRAEYGRLIAEWSVNNATVPPKPSTAAPSTDEVTVGQLRLAYFRHAEKYYVKNGLQTSEVDVVRMAVRTLKDYDHTPCRSFGPVALAACRQKMIDQGLARSSVNKLVGVIRQVFRWGAAQELIPGSIPQALACLPGLRKGRSAARECEPIGPVAEDVVEKAIAFLPPPVAAMVRLQSLTGARPGEIVIMRGCDLNTSGKIWEYTPGSFKTEHHENGRGRVIFIGPKAQEVLTAWLKPDLGAYLFSPRESIEATNAQRRENRQTPVYASHQARYDRQKTARGRRPDRDVYSVTSYRKAIERGCDRAGVPVFRPNQLRHSLATKLRREFGLEATGAVLGHSDLATSQIYAEKDVRLAKTVMGKIG